MHRGMLVLSALILSCIERRPLPAERTFESMLSAGGYHNVSGGINPQSVDVAAFGRAGIVLRQYEVPTTTRNVEQFLDIHDLAPGRIEDLMTVAAVTPTVIRGGSVCALGSPMLAADGAPAFPCAYEDGNGRRSLYLAYDDGSAWHPMFKFVARPK